jgi:hypothetical protein
MRLLPSILALIVGAALAALLRFPVQQRHGALGIAAMSASVILLLHLVGDLTGTSTRAPVDRLIDIALGCGLSIVALWINGMFQQGLGGRAEEG